MSTTDRCDNSEHTHAAGKYVLCKERIGFLLLLIFIPYLKSIRTHNDINDVANECSLFRDELNFTISFQLQTIMWAANVCICVCVCAYECTCVWHNIGIFVSRVRVSVKMFPFIRSHSFNVCMLSSSSSSSSLYVLFANVIRHSKCVCALESS